MENQEKVCFHSTLETTEEAVKISVVGLMEKARKDFENDFDLLEMHRFPACLRGLGDRYIVPMLVAIGPYHHASHHLQKMEVVKRTAASHLSERWGTKPSEEVCKAVLGVAERARKLYADHIVLADREFAEMMFFDACFLLYYMEEDSKGFKDSHALSKLLFSNRACIDNDIMLLENQLPWLVVQTIIDTLPRREPEHPHAETKPYKEVVEFFIRRMGSAFRIHEALDPFDLGDQQPQPHLLGFLRHYKIGKAGSQLNWPKDVRQISAPSAIELAEIGIKLRASVTSLFTDMDVTKGGPFCGKLSLAPLSLNDTRACCLVNMAAFEVATGSSYGDNPDRTAVCSYLALFSMFMLREEDVHELQAKRILEGHQSNAEMLAFFKSVVKHLPDTGSRFACIMFRIQEYKQKRWIWIQVYKFMCNNYRTIIKMLTIVGTLVGIFQALLAINQGQKNDTTPGQYLSFLPA